MEKEKAYKSFIKNKLKKIKKSFINNKNEIINLTENRTVFRLLSRPDIKAEKLLNKQQRKAFL